MLTTFEGKAFEAYWEIIQPLQWKLLNQEVICKRDWHDLLSCMIVFNLCDDQAKTNVEKLWEMSINEIDRLIPTMLNRITSHSDKDDMVRSYTEEWNKIFIQSNYMKSLYGTAFNNGAGDNMRDYILSKWYIDIFENLEDQFLDYFMVLLEEQRKYNSLDYNTIKGIGESFVNLSLYSGDHEPLYTVKYLPKYLKNTEIFYEIEGSQCLNDKGLVEYMKYVEKKINEENLKASLYLKSQTEAHFCCVKVLIEKPISAFLEETDAFFKSKAFVPLQLMYQVLSKTPIGLPKLLLKFESYMLSYGLTSIKEMVNSRDGKKYVELLIILQNTFHEFLRRSFNNNPSFLTALDKAFNCIVNDMTVFSSDIKECSSRTSPKLIASYLDSLLRVTTLSKRLTSQELDTRLKSLFMILEYITDKDIFLKYYKIHLMKRLILEATSDIDKEEKIISALKESGMPSNGLKQLSTMIQDIKVSSDLSRELNKKDTTVKILTYNTWMEGSKPVECVVLPELESQLSDIKTFYKSIHGTRKLLFHHHMATGTMTFKNNVGSFDLELTMLQMIILTAFMRNSIEKLSLDFLSLTTGLPKEELKKILWSLTAVAKLKHQVILNEPIAKSSQDFSSNTMFWVNMDFALVNKNGILKNRGKVSLLGKYNLNTAFSEESDVQLLRRLRVEESIMTVLKTRKRMSFSNLQLEVINILKCTFYPTTTLIENQIKKLIADDHIARDQDDKDVFVYIC